MAATEAFASENSAAAGAAGSATKNVEAEKPAEKLTEVGPRGRRPAVPATPPKPKLVAAGTERSATGGIPLARPVARGSVQKSFASENSAAAGAAEAEQTAEKLTEVGPTGRRPAVPRTPPKPKLAAAGTKRSATGRIPLARAVARGSVQKAFDRENSAAARTAEAEQTVEKLTKIGPRGRRPAVPRTPPKPKLAAAGTKRSATGRIPLARAVARGSVQKSFDRENSAAARTAEAEQTVEKLTEVGPTGRRPAVLRTPPKPKLAAAGTKRSATGRIPLARPVARGSVQKAFDRENSAAAGAAEAEQTAEKLTEVGPNATGLRRPPLPPRVRLKWIPTRMAQKSTQQLKNGFLRISDKAKTVRTKAETILSAINTSEDPHAADPDVICCHEPDREAPEAVEAAPAAPAGEPIPPPPKKRRLPSPPLTAPERALKLRLQPSARVEIGQLFDSAKRQVIERVQSGACSLSDPGAGSIHMGPNPSYNPNKAIKTGPYNPSYSPNSQLKLGPNTSYTPQSPWKLFFTEPSNQSQDLRFYDKCYVGNVRKQGASSLLVTVNPRHLDEDACVCRQCMCAFRAG